MTDLGGIVKRRETLKEIKMAAVLPYVPAITRGAMTVGSTALKYARSFSPEAASRAQAFFATQGKDVEVLAASKSPALQSAVVSTLFKNGMPAASFVEAAQLTADEARQYAQLISKFHVQQANSVDRAQAPKATSGDVYLDTLATNMAVKEICTFMGISSDQYSKLIRGVNSHTTHDIEVFQVDRRVRNEKYI